MVLYNVSLEPNCDPGLSNITIGMRNSFHDDEDNLIIGRQLKEPIHLRITGVSSIGPFVENITIPGLQQNQVYLNSVKKVLSKSRRPSNVVLPFSKIGCSYVSQAVSVQRLLL